MTPWFKWLTDNYGQSEEAGTPDNPFIMDLYQYGHYSANHDETPWCACCMNAALVKTGFVGTGRADAKSFLTLGDPCELEQGAIIVVQFPNGGYHVTCFDHWVSRDNNLAACLGGNQSNELKTSVFNLSGGKDHCTIVAVRWPQPVKT